MSWGIAPGGLPESEGGARLLVRSGMRLGFGSGAMKPVSSAIYYMLYILLYAVYDISICYGMLYTYTCNYILYTIYYNNTILH